MEVSFEGLVALISVVCAATMWIVSAIHSVRDSIKDLALSLHEDIKRHDAELEDHNERLEYLENKKETRYSD